MAVIEKNKIILVSMLILFVFGVFRTVSCAASFDCSKANHKIEIMICSNDDLSILDDELSKIYKENILKGNNDSKVILKNNQKAWLKHVRSIVDKNDLKSYEIKSLYLKRIKDLELSILNLDDLLIVSHDNFKQHKLSERSLRNIGISVENFSYEQNSRYPQILYPENDKTIAWNTFIKKIVMENAVPYFENPDTEFFLSFSRPYFKSGILSTSFIVTRYGAGAAHGGYEQILTHYKLDEKREATVDDFFNKDLEWKSELTEYVINDICTNADSYKCNRAKLGKEKITKTIANMEKWIITDDGIGIYFGLYVLGGYASGTYTSVIPWEIVNKYGLSHK